MKTFNGKEITQFYIKDTVSFIEDGFVHFKSTGIVLPIKNFEEELYEGKEVIMSFEETEDNTDSFHEVWQSNSYFLCDKNGNYEVDLQSKATEKSRKRKK